MLTWLAQILAERDSAFSVFQYIVLRGILSAMTALIISTLVGPKMISWLQEMTAKRFALMGLSRT